MALAPLAHAVGADGLPAGHPVPLAVAREVFSTFMHAAGYPGRTLHGERRAARASAGAVWPAVVISCV